MFNLIRYLFNTWLLFMDTTRVIRVLKKFKFKKYRVVAAYYFLLSINVYSIL